ncbi:MAG: acyl-CoA thioesterase [Mongoliibacter sp.]|jgi:acyl-CoA thioester hydrolase|uniref:acyl-CoA thioesterase n=1 Tax=Mongoliibacter sp. TaxID=2022438 RepID=UPI0012F0AF47|nr:thioesterase family protein [Mongoliibacter sp.]TVP52647.1 MAG: acyl-CoA thioesterase [Mongoliibacter sp.]
MEKFKVEDVISSFSFSVPVQVRFSDIDGYMHVNNGVYFSYFEHARASFLYEVCGWDVMEIGTVVANINIDYRLPIHALDSPSVFVRIKNIGNTSFEMEQVIMGETREGRQEVFAQATTVMVSVSMKTMRPVPVPEVYRAKMEDSSSKAL